MLSPRRYIVFGTWIIILGSLWALIAWINPDFAVTTVAGIIGLNLSILSLVTFTAVSKGLIQILVCTAVSIASTFVVGSAWLYVACHISAEDIMNPAICQNGKLDIGYAVLGWSLGLTVSLSVLLAALAWGKKQPPRS